MVIWMTLILTPSLVLITLAATSEKISVFVPSLSVAQCADYTSQAEYHASINQATMVFMNFEIVFCVLFLVSSWKLRNIQDEFCINKELRQMVITLFLTDAMYFTSLIFLYDTVFVVLGFV